MKFCKNLQRVVDISDPEWAPYWTNYKMLKKLIKELPSLVPGDEQSRSTTKSARIRARAPSTEMGAESPASARSTLSSESNFSGTKQRHGDKTAEPKAAEGPSTANQHDAIEHAKEELGRKPGEKAFFKLLHAELKKATHFFEKAQQEFGIREERVREGMEIMKQPNSIMVNEKWSLLAKSIYRLYKDLLLLETFAIMTYCAFSKILKKHDKVTGYQTKTAFMQNVVNKANFTHYPVVLEMIGRCERLYEEVSDRLVQEGTTCLFEDERLFINMINRLNEQVLNLEENDEGPPQRREGRTRASASAKIDYPTGQNEPSAISTLRSIVEENDARANAAQVSEGNVGVDDSQQRKRAAGNDVSSEDDSKKRSKNR